MYRSEIRSEILRGGFEGLDIGNYFWCTNNKKMCFFIFTVQVYCSALCVGKIKSNGGKIKKQFLFLCAKN